MLYKGFSLSVSFCTVATQIPETTLSQIASAFVDNLCHFDKAQIQAVGKALATREPDRMDAMITGMMSDRDLAKKLVRALARIYPEVIREVVAEA